jgi:tripartite ATP-independent transporter DctP family solute receptor
MRLHRKHFVAAMTNTVATAGFLRYPADAAELSYRMGTIYTPVDPVYRRAVQAAARVTQDTGGRVEIRVFPSNLLGSAPAMIEQVRLGALEFIHQAYTSMESLVPVTGIGGIPFTFTTSKAAYEAWDGSFGRYLRDAVLKANRNIYQFETFWGDGFRNVTNSLRPIYRPADIKGMKIRVVPVPTIVDMYKAFGATPVPTAGNEIYTAAQSHLVDGIDLARGSVDPLKLYEVQKYLSSTNHLWTTNVMFASSSVWDHLPKNLRDIIERDFNAAALLARPDVDRIDQNAEALLVSKGMVVNEADVQSFRTALRGAGAYAKWRDQYGAEAWALLEKTVGKPL